MVIVYACNTEKFANSPGWCFNYGLTKFFYVSAFLSQEACDQDRAYFAGHTGKYFFSIVLFIEKFRICEHSIPCALEINSNG